MLLADDHSIVRRGLRSLLEAAGVTVVAEAADGLEAVRLCEEHLPDVLILDVAMPKLNGIEVAARAQKLEPPPGVIMLSMHADESYIIRALAAGARAYLLKSATDEDLLPAVRAVAADKPFFSPAVTAVLVEDYVRTAAGARADRFVRSADRPREGSAAAAGRRALEQGSRDAARPRPVDGRDPPRQSDAEAQSPQHRGNRALRRPQGHHPLDIFSKPMSLQNEASLRPFGFRSCVLSVAGRKAAA